APLNAAFERVPRKNSLLYSAWLYYHGKAEGCTAALNKCSLCPHCSTGRRDPASAVPDAFPGEPHLYSTESRCPNGNRWRADLRSAGMSLELVSEAMPVVEETKIVLMPESCEEKVFPFPAKEIRKQEVTVNVFLSQMDEMDPEDLIIVKFALKYYILKKDK
ncbi:hypothetical protein pdam_00025921, partial [Pocillopora damicornis]